MYFQATIDELDGWSRVSVVGDLDLATIGEFRRAVRQALARSPHLIVDLGAMDFVDSLGLGVIVGARRRAVAQAGALVVVCDEPRITALLGATRLDEILDVRPSFAPPARNR